MPSLHGTLLTWPALVGTVLLALLVGACGGAATQPTQPAAAPTTAKSPTSAAPPAASPPAPSAASPVSASAAASPAVASPSPAPRSSPAAVAPSTASPSASGQPVGGVRLAVAAGSSEARFRAREQLAGRNLPNDAVGATRDVSGTIALSPSGSIVREGSKIVVDLTTLKSDESRRDNWIQRNTLQTAQFPTAEFVPAEARGLPGPLPASGEATFQLLGDLTVHGVTRPATWEVTVQFSGQEVTGLATTRVKMTDFGMTPPRVGPVLSIDDELTLELEFRATRA